MAKELISKLSFIVLLLIIFLVFNQPPAHAQFSDSMRTEMRKVRKRMFEEGNNNFIIIDAIIDQLVKLKLPYKFEYEKGMVQINGYRLRPTLETLYRDKMIKFLGQANGSQSKKVSFTGRVSLQEIFDPKSYFNR